jgi:hypothetical protein
MPRASKPQPAAATGPRLVRKTTTPKPVVPPASPSERDIAIRAYEIFEQEGGRHGNHVEHWLRAERELMETIAPAKRTASTRTPR